MIYPLFFLNPSHKLSLSHPFPPSQPTPFRPKGFPSYFVENIELIRSEYPDFSNAKFTSIYTHPFYLLSPLKPKGRPHLVLQRPTSPLVFGFQILRTLLWQTFPFTIVSLPLHLFHFQLHTTFFNTLYP